MARVISAVVFIPILIVTLWRGAPIYFAALVGVALALGLIEYYRLAERVGARGGRVQGILAAAALLTAFYQRQHEWIVAVLAALVVVELAVQLFTASDLRATVTAAAGTRFA